MRVEQRKKPISKWRVAAVLVAVAISITSAIFLQPLVSKNENAINTVVTIFSILAGFLVAVITFIGDPGKAGWRELQLGKRQINAKLNIHRILFYLYLVTLGLAFAVFIIPPEYATTLLWLERFFVGLATFVFLTSFTLPSSLTKLQMERYTAALNDQLPEALRPSRKVCNTARQSDDHSDAE
ncbi:hypothetical protein [Cereibacter johrii]|uniref:hypothetical protein n=1 Tax=Cereibacter johrii TaxID=445629 RepID=UPI003CF90746